MITTLCPRTGSTLRPLRKLLFALVVATVAAAPILADETSSIAQTAAPVDGSRELARVNGVAIRESHLQLYARVFGLNEQDLARNDLRQKLVERLIDQTLLRQYLDKLGIPQPTRETALLLKTVDRRLREQRTSLAEVLRGLNLTEEAAAQIVGLQLRWAAAARRLITNADIRRFWTEHRSEVDGTRVRIRHIVRRIPRNAPDAKKRREDTIREFETLRQQIAAGNLTFADAAKTHSEAPSAGRGGDLGYIRFEGAVPPTVAEVAFHLKPGEVSPPIESPLGVHLVQLEDRRPGNLSLEDARPKILERLASQKQQEIIRAQRSRSVITYAHAN